MFLLLLACTVMYRCSKISKPVQTSPFSMLPVSHPLQPGLIDETSAIADSNINPDHLWVQMDNGNPGDLHLLGYKANYITVINIKGLRNRDCEDMALGNGPSPGTKFIYLADIGDNDSKYKTSFIYRFAEPLIPCTILKKSLLHILTERMTPKRSS